MSLDDLFEKIIAKELPSDMLYQDDLVTAFRDINPSAPTHVLIVPNKVIRSVNDVSADDEATMGRMWSVAARIAREEGIAESGYRLIVNCGSDGHQEVPHIHMHIVGGRDLGRMLPAAG